MTLRVRRFDSMTIGQPTKTAHGFLRVPATVSKVGVLEYPRADGSVWRELVTPEALFDKESMDSAACAPVTNLHPLDAVDASNAKDHMRGFTGEQPYKDGTDGLGINLTITDADLIKDIESGKKREMSAGYFAVLDRTPGTYNGQKYDAKQVARLHNHFAVVPEGRAGHDVRLKMDSNSLELVEEEHLMKFYIDGVGEVEMTEAMVSAYKAKQAPASNADAAALTAANKAAAEAQARADANQAELDKLKAAETAKNTDAAKAAEEKARQDAVNAKVALIATASKLVKPEVSAKFTTMDAVGIMKAAIMASDTKAQLDGKSEAYLQARFDMLQADATQATNADAAQKKLGEQLLAGGGDPKADAAQPAPHGVRRADAVATERHSKLDSAWKQPVGARQGQPIPKA